MFGKQKKQKEQNGLDFGFDGVIRWKSLAS
jgi:hypothetical protein